MKFYSYDYVLSQISNLNWSTVIGLLILLAAVAYFSLLYYRNNRDGKYRELVIILVLMALTLSLTTFTSYQTNQASDNQYRSSLHFIEVVSEELDVDKSKVYVNTSAATDGAILKVEDKYYRAISTDNPDVYLLEKMELHHAKVELVEVEK